MNNNLGFVEDQDENQVNLRLNISKKQQLVDIEVDGNMKIPELYAIIADYVKADEKNIRLVAKGDRVSKEGGKTVREYFNVPPGGREEITVFFESQGAAL